MGYSSVKRSEKSLSESKEVKAIVYLSHSLSNIKRMDLSKISLFKVKLEQYLADNFGRIKKDLLQYKSAINNSQQELFNELIKELILSLRQLKPLLNKRAQLSNIGILEKSFENLLVSSDENLEESFNDVISKLEELIKTLLE